MILVGGVGQLWQGDLDIGRRAVERLAGELAGRPSVLVEDLYYGAVAVAQRLQDLDAHALVLVGAASRPQRPPGTVSVRRRASTTCDPRSLQAAVADAVTGYVAVDLLVEVAAGLGALPPVVVVVEVEPATTSPDEHLSPLGEAALDEAVATVRAQVAAVESG